MGGFLGLFGTVEDSKRKKSWDKMKKNHPVISESWKTFARKNYV